MELIQIYFIHTFLGYYGIRNKESIVMKLGMFVMVVYSIVCILNNGIIDSVSEILVL